MNKLIIVESKNKVKSISKYIKKLQREGLLDKKDDYIVNGSVGHILEIKNRWFPTKEEIVWEPEKSVIKGKASVIKELNQQAKVADIVLVATDPDREGEAIADDLVNKLKIEDKYGRISFNEITKDSIFEALNNIKKVDYKMVNAAKTRQILDRLYGFKLSGWTRRKIWNDFGIKSAGRVQSPTLKLVLERELLIEGFKPISYIKIQQDFGNDIIADIVLKDKNIDGKSNLLDPKYFNEVKSTLKGELKVKNVSIKNTTSPRKVPFKQSAVYKAASSSYGMSAASSRAAMQHLYESGLISYPRTDSTRYSETFIKMARNHILNTYGKEFVAFEIKGTASGSQDAHEALRVTDPKMTPDKIKLVGARLNMYKLIYNHTMHTLMTPPKREVLTYKMDDNGYEFRMSSSKVTFKGYLVVGGYKKSNELPKFSEGDFVKSENIIYTEGETKPAGRYNEGSLISKMEEVGIGRPSTFSTTVATLLKREYVTKEGKALKITERGRAVIISLILYFNNIVNVEFTEKLELLLDDIAKDKVNYKDELTNFWKKLNNELEISTIKYKPNEQDKTIIINLSELVEPNLTKASANQMGPYDKKYEDLITTFEKYLDVTNKSISINYKKFVDQEFDNFTGHIFMKPKPKKIAFIKVGRQYEIYDRQNINPNTIKCPDCENGFVVYRRAERRGKTNWFEACSGFPKCRHSLPIKQEEQDILENKKIEVEKK